MKAVPVLSVKKALDLLERLAVEDGERQGIGLSELAKPMGLASNTARNLLKTMIVCGFVAQNAGGKYMLGPKCAQFDRPGRRRILEGLALPILRRLGASVEEVVLLSVLHNGQRAVIAQVDPQRSIRADPGVVPSPGMYEFVTGRVLVAYAGEDEWKRTVERHGFPGSQWDGIQAEAKLRAAAEAIRCAGEAVMVKAHEGLIAFAVPVLTMERSLIGALGCYAPTFRCPDKKQREILAGLRKAATALAEQWEPQS